MGRDWYLRRHNRTQNWAIIPYLILMAEGANAAPDRPVGKKGVAILCSPHQQLCLS
jgi:hypothetical protein